MERDFDPHIFDTSGIARCGELSLLVICERIGVIFGYEKPQLKFEKWKMISMRQLRISKYHVEEILFVVT